jgi:hypothetical protein
VEVWTYLQASSLLGRVQNVFGPSVLGCARKKEEWLRVLKNFLLSRGCLSSLWLRKMLWISCVISFFFPFVICLQCLPKMWAMGKNSECSRLTSYWCCLLSCHFILNAQKVIFDYPKNQIWWSFQLHFSLDLCVTDTTLQFERGKKEDLVYLPVKTGEWSVCRAATGTRIFLHPKPANTARM